MWNPLLLLGLWLLLLLLLRAPDFGRALRALPCDGNVYRDCFHYCEFNCKDVDINCMHQCENGCGCMVARVMRNNGGCHEVRTCEFLDRTDEEEDITASPCTDFAFERENENGEDVLNLVEFNTRDPHV